MAQELDSITHMMEPNLESMMVPLSEMELVEELDFVPHTMEILSGPSMAEILR